MKKFIIAASALSVFVVAGTVMAQQSRPMPNSAASSNACLQYNRLERWSVVNSSTLSITDKTEKKYRVALSSDCAHSSFVDRVAFQRLGKSKLDCVEPGDRVRLIEADKVPELCLVSNVSMYTDAQRKIDEKTNPSKP